MIIESAYLIVTQAIQNNSKPPSQIFNLVEDIITCTRTLENIKFLYRNRFANALADKLAKRAHLYCTPGVIYNI